MINFLNIVHYLTLVILYAMVFKTMYVTPKVTSFCYSWSRLLRVSLGAMVLDFLNAVTPLILFLLL